MTKSLVLFSGGVESTSLLKHLLETTPDQVEAVHFYVPNSVRRQALEWAACMELIPRLREIRPFGFHRVDLTLPWDTRDAEVQLALVPALLTGSRSNRFYRGLCKEDWRNGDHGKRMLITSHVVSWLTACGRTPTTVDEVSPNLPHLHLTKKEHMDYLGPLLKHTFSCLSPEGDAPCLRCSTCKLREQAHEDRTARPA